MRARRRRAALAASILLFGTGAPTLAAQAAGSVRLGASVVEFDGFLASATALIAPTFTYEGRSLSVAAQGSWSVFESGRSILQADLGAAWLAGTARWWRVEFSGSTGLSEYAGQSEAGHLLGGARLHVFGRKAGGWVGATGGPTFATGEGAASAVELSAGAWTVQGRLALIGSATVAGQGDRSVLDLVGAARLSAPGVTLEGRLGVRPTDDGSSGEGGGTSFGEITARVPLGARVGLSLGAGTYPSDPVRRLLGATYFNAGLEIRFAGRARPADVRFDPAVLRGRNVPEADGPAGLSVEVRGGSVLIAVRAVAATRVELMADFTDWQPVSLTPAEDGRFVLAIPLDPGSYRVNIRLDGGPWIAPGGTRVETTEFGGSVGVVVVP